MNQCQINEKTGMTFASGLRAILRQDPYIIAVGEIRDGETASIAMRAAITGRLVFSTPFSYTHLVVIRLFNLNLNRNLSYKLKNLTYENITLS